ncbi:MAG: Type 1 glutamine amidotransferase-like domain-containing protein [Erysipelotrichaceae bacterium]|nr:Type 1 glutamine amidotransferase-like domain-containing protein [Erysipelotrichaceae bacterium]
MICFLTSNTVMPDTNTLNPANGFIDELRNCLPESCRALVICSDPVSFEITDYYSGLLKESFEEEGFVFENFVILDDRNYECASELIYNSNLIVLSGGHVPTQNAFFVKIGLKELLKNYQGIIIGISAGSMNSAELVYAQPEAEGEGIDESYVKFMEGLGLTEVMILPHYQQVKDDILDGMRLFEDITYGDSYGHTFHVFPDGTYLYINEGIQEIRGECYVIEDGQIKKIAEEGDVVNP